MTVKQMYEFLETLYDGGFDDAPIVVVDNNREREVSKVSFTADSDGDGFATIKMTEQPTS